MIDSSYIKPLISQLKYGRLHLWGSVFLSHLGLVVFQQPFGSRPSGVVRHVEDHHALLLPADEGTVRHALHHGQEVLVAVVTGGDHGEGGPVVLFEHLEDDLELECGGAGELEVDGAALLKGEEFRL